MHCLGVILVVSVIALGTLPSLAEPAETEKRKDVAVTAFSGQMTSNDWLDPVAREPLELRDSWLFGLAGAKELTRFFDYLVVEIEGQAVRHFGGQDHWEFNAPVVLRWERFPWDHIVDTGVAYGIGPSYATQKPSEEINRTGDSERWLVYWMIELEFGLPAVQDWSAVARLHHRSGAWGLVADEGGSNVLSVGVKRRF